MSQDLQYQYSEAKIGELAQLLLEAGHDKKIYIFHGELGSGKTTLIKAMCKQLGVHEDEMSSPSYGIINHYKNKADKDIFHIDCYRLETEEEAWDTGLPEILDSGNYCFVEWPEVIDNLLPENYVCVIIHYSKKERIYNIKLP